MTDLAARPLSERQMLIRNIVVEHPRYLEAFEGLRCLHQPVKGGLHAVGTLGMLIGDSRAGKTFVAKRYAKGFADSIGEEGVIRPVVYVDMPTEHGGGVKGVLANIADALEFLHTPRMTLQIMVAGILKSLKDRQVQFLILDEFEQVFRENDRRVSGFGRGLIRKILNLQTLSVACVGLTTTYGLLREDDQLVGRGGLPYREIKPYDWNNEEERRIFQEICGHFDKGLPFDESSRLGGEKMSMALSWVSDGNLGLLKLMIEAAAAYALNDDACRIEREHFARAYEDRMPVGTSFNPFLHAMSQAPQKKSKVGNVKAGGTGQVFSTKTEKNLRDGV